MGLPTQDEMRVEFRRLKAEIATMEAAVKPLRDQYDKMSQDFHKKIKPLIKQIKEAEAPIFDLKNQMGTIVRALGGKTGDN